MISQAFLSLLHSNRTIGTDIIANEIQSGAVPCCFCDINLSKNTRFIDSLTFTDTIYDRFYFEHYVYDIHCLPLGYSQFKVLINIHIHEQFTKISYQKL